MNQGKLEVIAGPMFSGKTTELLRRIEREQIAKRSIKMYKPEIDTRHAVSAVTDRNRRLQFDAEPLPLNLDEEGVRALVARSIQFDVIGIDEVQFFAKWIVGFCQELRRIGQGKRVRVIVCGLDMTFRGEPFGHMGELMAVADSVQKFSAVCVGCSADAIYSQRLLGGLPAPHGDTVQIGDGESYEPRCSRCFVPPTRVEFSTR